ncbi:MAG TPA: AraC family transcriptional regulator [Blastocatellia bacterium]|jgi:AraC family transcriptional regulator|nr:AraC family transcriptional regulator [Blastocatellia bacterium]
MATPKRLIESKLARHHTPYVFGRSLSWPGVKVGHARFFPGEMANNQLGMHHIYIPLDGSYEGTMVVAGGHIVHGERTVGDAAIVPAGQQYKAVWREEFEDVGIHLDPDFVSRQARELAQNDHVDLIRACEIGDPLVHQIGRSLAAEVDAGAPAGRIYAESLVNTLVAYMIRHYSSAGERFRHNLGGLPKHKLRRVTEFIEENLEYDLTLAEIAEIADLSPFHFARAFKQSTGSTPIQFLTRRRIDLAKRLLAESELTIVEVGLRAGFKNQSHFTTLFRKITAMTPRAYRNEHLS